MDPVRIMAYVALALALAALAYNLMVYRRLVRSRRYSRCVGYGAAVVEALARIVKNGEDPVEALQEMYVASTAEDFEPTTHADQVASELGNGRVVEGPWTRD